MDVPDLLVDPPVLRDGVDERPLPVALECRKGHVLLDVQGLDQATTLAILRDERDARIDHLRDAADGDGPAVEPDRSRVLGTQAHDALEHLGASGTQKAVDAQHLALPEVEAHVVDEVPSARLGQAEVADLEDLGLRAPIDDAITLGVLLLATGHLLDDPADADVLDVSVVHVPAVAQDGDVIADLHDLLETMGDVGDGEAAGRKLTHDPEEDLYLLLRQ